MENLWATMKRRIEKNDCSTAEKLISAIIRTWYHDDEVAKMCSTLVDSMPKCVKMLIKAKGGHSLFLIKSIICQIFPITAYNKPYFNKYWSHFITVRINLHSTVCAREYLMISTL